MQYSTCAVFVGSPELAGRVVASMTVTVDEFEVADPTAAWTRAGFSVDSGGDTAGVCRIGGVGIRLVGRGRGTGIVGWSLRGLPPDISLDDLDGVPTTRSRPDGDIGPRSGAVTATSGTHANGVTAIEHVVLLSPDLGRTVESLAAVGVDPRRERDGGLGGRPIRQIFFRLGEVIVTTLQHHELGMSVRSAMISAPIRDR
jgi:hypothetical protein